MKPVTPQQPQPDPFRGFEHINRFWDKGFSQWSAKILPGEFYVSPGGEVISTVLGSCISVCIKDKQTGVGGMNHFMLPSQEEHSSVDWGSNSSAARYGNWAMEYLINEIMKNGGLKRNFEVKVFGGGQILANMTDIGQRNILFALDFLRREGLNPDACDVGDVYPRKVYFNVDTGKVRVRKLSAMKNQTIVRREKAYMDSIEEHKDDVDIELFD